MLAPTRGRLLGRHSRSPRPTSIWSASSTHTALEANASPSGTPPGPQIADTVVVKPEGRTTISSPGLNTPAATVPAKPRKSDRGGRITYWTGRRGGVMVATGGGGT